MGGVINIMADQSRQKGRQGLASMDPKRKREIQSMGGKASHKNDRRGR